MTSFRMILTIDERVDYSGTCTPNKFSEMFLMEIYSLKTLPCNRNLMMQWNVICLPQYLLKITEQVIQVLHV